MEKTIFNKLVRDRIPDIIKSSGKEVFTRIANNNEEFLTYLSKKLIEESTEFSVNIQSEELADILEIILTILDVKGETLTSLDSLRKEKKNKRGGFDNRIILLSKTD